mgnify:FL=1
MRGWRWSSDEGRALVAVEADPAVADDERVVQALDDREEREDEGAEGEDRKSVV